MLFAGIYVIGGCDLSPRLRPHTKNAIKAVISADTAAAPMAMPAIAPTDISMVLAEDEDDDDEDELDEELADESDFPDASPLGEAWPALPVDELLAPLAVEVAAVALVASIHG